MWASDSKIEKLAHMRLLGVTGGININLNLYGFYVCLRGFQLHEVNLIFQFTILSEGTSISIFIYFSVIMFLLI